LQPKKLTEYLTSGLFLCLLFIYGNSAAAPATPLLTRNESPFSLIYGLPHTSPARLIEQDKKRWISSLNISNTVNTQFGSNDQLLIDVETWHLNLFYDYGFKDNWMLRLRMPFIAHSGGFLDSPIETYHQALGLPNGPRSNFPRDQIAIQYSRNGISIIDITNREKDIGDITIQLAMQAHKANHMALSYWSSLKLPTGNYKTLTGSGSTDIAAWAAMDYQITDTRWLYGQAGLMYMHNNKVLPDIHNKLAVFSSVGMKFQPWDPVQLKAQLEYHSAFFDTDIKFLGQVLQLTLGGSYLINETHKLDFAVAEDIMPGASPDVNFNISWRVNF